MLVSAEKWGINMAGGGEGGGGAGGSEVVQDVNREGRPLSSSSSVAEQLRGRPGAGEGRREHPTVTRYKSSANLPKVSVTPPSTAPIRTRHSQMSKAIV